MKLQGVGVLAYWSARDSIILPFQGAETVRSCTKPALKPGSYCIRINEGVIPNLPIKGDGLALGEKKAKTGQCCPRVCALGASLWPQHRQPMQMRSCLLSRASWVRRGEGPTPLPTQGRVNPRADVMFRTCSSSQPSGGDAELGSVLQKQVWSPERWLFLHCAFFQHLPDRPESAPHCPEVAELQGRVLETPRLPLGSCSSGSGSPGQTPLIIQHWSEKEGPYR